MNAKRVTAAEGVVFAALQTRQTAAGIAMALESACLLQSPESAAEMRALRAEASELRARVTELEAQPTTADVAAWLAEKAREYRSVPSRVENSSEVLFRMADKVSRGAIRPARTAELETGALAEQQHLLDEADTAFQAMPGGAS